MTIDELYGHVCQPPQENSDWTCECGQFFPQHYRINFIVTGAMANHITLAIAEYAYRTTDQTAKQELLALATNSLEQIGQQA